MTLGVDLTGAAGLCVLAVDLHAAEYDTLAGTLPESDPGPRLLGVSLDPQAFAGLESDDLAAVITPLASFEALRATRPGEWVRGGAVPVLILLSPGEEDAASSLLAHDHIDFMVRTGAHLPLLAAWLPRALRRRQLGWEEIGRLVRHEINNPLTGVLGNAELILAGPNSLPAPVRNRLSVIVNLAVRMRDVVRTLEERLRPPGDTAPARSRSDSSSAQPLPH
jgi:signal transduction histidine kinase